MATLDIISTFRGFASKALSVYDLYIDLVVFNDESSTLSDTPFKLTKALEKLFSFPEILKITKMVTLDLNSLLLDFCNKAIYLRGRFDQLDVFGELTEPIEVPFSLPKTVSQPLQLPSAFSFDHSGGVTCNFVRRHIKEYIQVVMLSLKTGLLIDDEFHKLIVEQHGLLVGDVLKHNLSKDFCKEDARSATDGISAFGQNILKLVGQVIARSLSALLKAFESRLKERLQYDAAAGKSVVGSDHAFGSKAFDKQISYKHDAVPATVQAAKQAVYMKPASMHLGVGDQNLSLVRQAGNIIMPPSDEINDVLQPPSPDEYAAQCLSADSTVFARRI
ncbi:hypothetical protein LTR66_015996 [Elasticomyces elasticus]|nr:hypothetical protein LTR66_015996 [Elasticomyces elasticus]